MSKDTPKKIFQEELEQEFEEELEEGEIKEVKNVAKTND